MNRTIKKVGILTAIFARVFDILASKKSLQAAPGFIFLSNLNFLLARYG